MGNSDCLTWVRLQQPQEQSYSVLQKHAGSFPFSVINPNSDLNYRIFNMHTWSFLCMHIYICKLQRLGTPTASQHNIFDLEKLMKFFVLDGIRTRVTKCEVWCFTNWATPPPHIIFQFHTYSDTPTINNVCAFWWLLWVWWILELILRKHSVIILYLSFWNNRNECISWVSEEYVLNYRGWMWCCLMWILKKKECKNTLSINIHLLVTHIPNTNSVKN